MSRLHAAEQPHICRVCESFGSMRMLELSIDYDVFIEMYMLRFHAVFPNEIFNSVPLFCNLDL